MSEPTKVKESAGEQATSFMPSDEWGSFQFTTSADAKRAERMFNQLSSERDAFEADRDQLRERVGELESALRDLLDKVHQERMAWDQDDAHVQLEYSFRKAEKLLAKERP